MAQAVKASGRTIESGEQVSVARAQTIRLGGLRGCDCGHELTDGSRSVCSAHQQIATLLAEERADERAAVVRWLRANELADRGQAELVRLLSNEIERRWHIDGEPSFHGGGV
jgi:hypothetical protein